MAQLLASIYSMLSVERNKNTTILSSAKLASFVILSVLTTSHPLYILIAIIMISFKESYVIGVTKNKITEASSESLFLNCHMYLMKRNFGMPQASCWAVSRRCRNSSARYPISNKYNSSPGNVSVPNQ